MSFSIPYYHSSMVLGSIASPDIISLLAQIQAEQDKVLTAQGRLDSHIALKRSLTMTMNEMVTMNIDVSSLADKVQETDAAIVQAANDYASASLAGGSAVQLLKEKIFSISPAVPTDSPVDFDKSLLKHFDLSSPSVTLDAQYFSYESINQDNPVSVLNNMENYIRAATSELGNKPSANIATAASAQIALQQKNYNLTGTLVITAVCTHPKVAMITPLVLDADAAVQAWNKLYPDNTIDTAAISKNSRPLLPEEDTGNTLDVLSGFSHGSGFVGMVHTVKREETGGRKGALVQMAESLQEQVKIANWLEDACGGIGADASIMENIRHLLNQQQLIYHVTLVVMGAIPSIKSREVDRNIKAFADISADKLTAHFNALENTYGYGGETVSTMAQTANKDGKAVALQNAGTQSLMMGLSKIEQRKDKEMDISSLLTAFDDYIGKVANAQTGVPMHFFVKRFSKTDLERQWRQKYITTPVAPANTALPGSAGTARK